MERAKQLRDERKNGTLSENDTFQPQVNPRRPSSNQNVKPVDSLDKLASNYSNDIMEQPLAAQRNRQIPQQTSGPLSPGSDALGKEVKRHGSSGSQYESVNKRQADAHYKSKFLQQYEDSHAYVHNQNHPNGGIPPPSNISHNQPHRIRNDDNALEYHSDNNRSAGTGWNNDTSTNGGFDAPPPRVKKPSRPAVQQATQNRYQQPDNAYSEPLRPPRASPRASSGGDMMSQYNAQPEVGDMSQAKPKLSLLKSKIRLSQGAGSSNMPPPEPVAYQPSNNSRRGQLNNAHFEEELQSHSKTVDIPLQKRQPMRSHLSHQDDARSQNSNPDYDENELHGGDSDIMIAVPKNRTILKKANSDNFGNHGNNPYNPSFQNSQSNRPRQNQYHPDLDEHEPMRNQRHQLPSHTRNGFNPSYDDASQYHQHPQQNPVAKFNPTFDNPPQQPSKSKFSPTYDDPPQQPSNSKFNPVYDDPRSNMDDEQDEEDDGPVDESLPQHECPDCGRKFNEIAFSKHVKICRKVFVQKRKAFDSTKMRIGDNQELVKIFTKAQKEERKQQLLAQKQAKKNTEDDAINGGEKASKWKEQSRQFREAMKAAREYSKAKESGAPLPPPPVSSAPDPSLIPCPHCGRRFNDKAAERHIPQCQNIKAKPNTLKRGSGVNSANGGAIAANKKDARKKF